jgi:putative heme iron utilization protein
VPQDDAIVVPVSKLKKVWDSLSELRSYVCEIRLERTILRLTLLPVNTVKHTLFSVADDVIQ